MKFSVVSLFPELIRQGCSHGVVGRAFESQLANLQVYNPRDFGLGTHKQVDDRPFGGGDGMIMMSQPLDELLQSVHKELAPARRIYLSPRGRPMSDSLAMELSQESHLLLLCGRYGGVDQRHLNRWSYEEISAGDYVLSGGELPALCLIDACLRKVPGVLGHDQSAHRDSFSEAFKGGLEGPSYTRPAKDVEGQSVPEVFLSGDHARIEKYRWFCGAAWTWMGRPDLFCHHFSKDQRREVASWVQQLGQEELESLGLVREKMKLSVALGEDE